MKTRRIAGAIAALAVAATATACSAESEEAASSASASAPVASDDAFPVTIEHAFGSTTIEEAPERIATVAWMNHEVPLALGIVPVGMSYAAWGDDDGDGVLPWVEDKLTELGAQTPVLFDETDGIDFEAIAATEPDIILATYSGLTQEDYDTLSQIAPVVAYPEVAWGTSWEDMVLISSTALGLGAEGEALVDELHVEIQAAAASYPDLEGKKVLFAYVSPADLSTVGFYTSHDTRPGFLESIGMVAPQAVADATAADSAFYTSISAEQVDLLSDVDVVVTYGDTEGELVALLQADPLLSQIPAVANGAIAVLPDATPLAASANPSPLSISWGIDEYLGLIAGALAPQA